VRTLNVETRFGHRGSSRESLFISARNEALDPKTISLANAPGCQGENSAARNPVHSGGANTLGQRDALFLCFLTGHKESMAVAGHQC